MLREIRIAESWPARALLAGALLVSLLVGLVLAWQVFPTRWVDTDPSDLRAEHQADYVALVADSWTVSGNANVARERLYELVDDDTDWAAVDALMVDAMAELEAEGNSAAALRIGRMRDAVPLPVGAPAAVVDMPSAAETAEEPEDSAGGAGWLLPILGIGLVLVAGGGAAYVVTTNRRRAATPADVDLEPLVPSLDERRQGAALSLNPLPGFDGLEAQFAGEDEPLSEAPASLALSEPEEISLDLQGETDDEEAFSYDDDDGDGESVGLEAPLAHMPDLEPEEAWHVESLGAIERTPTVTDRPTQVTGLTTLADDDLELEDDAEAAEPPAHWEAATPAAATLGPGELGVFETVYQFGDDDFYHAFTIESPSHEFLGQCGIVISDVLGVDQGQLVDAFDIWLFETQGTRTISKVLASEHAYGTKSISAKLARKGELVRAQEGLMIPLETESIRLTASIEDVSYRAGTADAASVFERLKIRMVVEQVS